LTPPGAGGARGWDPAGPNKYAKARFYDPEVGRFISQDSFLGDINDPPSLHRFFYANANPTRYIDPTGHQADDWQAIVKRAEQERKAREAAKAAGQAPDAPFYGNQPEYKPPDPNSPIRGAAFDPTLPLSEIAHQDRERLEYYAKIKGMTLEQARAELERQGAKLDEARARMVVEHPSSMTGGEVAETTPDGVDRTIAQIQAGKEQALRFASEAAGVAKVASEIGFSVAFDPVERVVIITTGRDLNGNEASRLMAAAPLGVGVVFKQGGKAVRALKGAEKAAEEAGDVARTESRIVSRVDAPSSAAVPKRVPNPYGKLGSPAHQAKVREVMADIEARGLRVDTEVPIPTVGGAKDVRYMDVVARDPVTLEIVEVHQVGKVLKSDPRVPIARERAALRDVRRSPELRDAKRIFHEY
jgi:RHS repeat-associated protein